MFKASKRLAAALLAGAMLVSSALTVFADTASPTVVNNPSGNCEIEVEGDSATITEVKDQKTAKLAKHVSGSDALVDTLGSGAFEGNTKTTSIICPTTIVNFESKCFSGATKVKSIKIRARKVKKVAKTAFKGLKTQKITIKANKKMTKANRKKFEKQLKNAGFKGKIKYVKMP